MAGYSGTSLIEKLGIKEGARMATVNAPADFREQLGLLPLDVQWANRVRHPLDLIVAFHTQRSGLVANWPTLTAAAQPAGAVWIAWPKKASGLITDIDDTVLREELLPSGWVDNKVCAIDETWTGLRFVLRVERRPKSNAAAAKPARIAGTRPRKKR